MSWLRSEKGNGFFGGFWRRPSTILLTLAALLFGLQLFPGTGIFLMLFGASLWTGLLLAGFLIAVAIEAWSGYLPRVFVLLPVAIMAGFVGTAAAQRAMLWLGAGYSAAGNIAGSLVVDPVADVILIDFERSDEYAEARSVVSSGRLNRAYYRESEDSYARIEPMPAAGCLPPAKEADRPFRLTTDRPVIEVDLCRTLGLPKPENVTLLASRRITSGQYFGGQVETTMTTVTRSDGTAATWTSMRGEAIFWLPLPVAGCGLVSGGPNAGWRCAAGAISSWEEFATPPDGLLPVAALLRPAT